MAKAIVLRKYGKSNVLKLEDIEIKKPKENELLIRQTAIGVHFHDIYVRSGLYKTLELPGILGLEAVGIIEEIGAGIDDFKKGDKIGYITKNYGAYSSHRILDKNLAVKIPDFISDEIMATNNEYGVIDGDRVMYYTNKPRPIDLIIFFNECVVITWMFNTYIT